MSILPGPVGALYGETVAGAAVIRAFGMQSLFVQSELFVHVVFRWSADTLETWLGQLTCTRHPT
jgi:hypothetical protein